MNIYTNQELYAEYQRIVNEFGYGSMPGRVQLLGWDLEFGTSDSILAFIDQILYRRMNDFYADADQPLILDCGANIGYTVLNYKRLYPKAKIIAFEPDPDFIPILERNVERNGLNDVQIINSAVWTKDGEVSWFSEGVDGSRIVQENGHSGKNVTVSSVDLARYLLEDVDLLKLDVEEAEFSVIPHISEHLHKVKNILVEIHIKDQSRYGGLAKIIEVLVNSGFEISINSYSAWRDLIRRHIPPTASHSEQYILLAGWRSEHQSVSHEPTFLPYNSILMHEEYSVSVREAKQAGWYKASNALLQESLLSFAKNRKSAPWKVATLQGEIIHDDSSCWISILPSVVASGDSLSALTSSSLLLFEDNHLLGPAHVPHAEIQAEGAGRYLHWLSQLYFSTSDGTDPNKNGRIYTIFWRDEQLS